MCFSFKTAVARVSLSYEDNFCKSPSPSTKSITTKEIIYKCEYEVDQNRWLNELLWWEDCDSIWHNATNAKLHTLKSFGFNNVEG